MTAQELKNSILQLAVQGKLVPQNAEDENASELIKRIRDERLAWIAEGRIKKDKPLPAIKEDKITIELPDSWVWCRIGEVFVIVRGITFPSEAKNTVIASDLVPCATTGSVQDTYNYNADVFVSEQFVKRNDQWLLPNDIIMSTANSRELVGKTCIWTSNERKTFGGFLTVLRPGTGILPKYAYYALMSIKASGAFLKTATQTTNIANINSTVLQNTLFPLPPVDEQAHIVSKIEELLPLIEEYGEAEQKLSALNADFPEMLRKSILQQAVQGKLTERDPADEPASELLKRIRTEKAKLIAEGKIKKEKPLPPITDEEKPFDIPDTWEWVRLSDVIDVRDGTHDTPKYITSGYPLITGKDFYNGHFQLDKTQYISEADYLEIIKRSKVDIGDILFSMIGGNIGSMIRITTDNYFEMGIKNVALFKQYMENETLSCYLFYFLKSQIERMRKSAKGGAQPFVPLNLLRSYPFPLPPLEEQKRIVARVEELLAVCEGLK